MPDSSVATAAAGHAQGAAASSLLHVAQVITRRALRIVRLHGGVGQASALVGRHGRAAQSYQASRAEPVRSVAHPIRGFTTAALSLCMAFTTSVAAESPHRREPASQPTANPADVALKGGAEVALYSDNQAVTVVSPSVAATVSDKGATWSARGGYLADIVSAASVDIVSSASSRWTEVRHEAQLGARRAFERVNVRVNLAASREPDYVFFGVGGLVDFSLRNQTFNPVVGYNFSHDTAGRTGTPFSVFAKELSRHTWTVGSEVVLDRATVLFLQADAVLELGDSSKPYRFLPLFSADSAPRVHAGASLATVNQLRLPGRVGERVPGSRLRGALFARLSRRLSHATVQVAERLYVDDWGLVAATSDVRYLQDVGARWLLWGSVRGHVQSGVYFWNRAYVSEVGSGRLTVPEYRTGDRELSPLLSGTLGLGARYGFAGGSRPQARNVSLQYDVTATSFRDALFVSSRIGQLVVVQLEAAF